ncbi:polyprotein [Gossypium australe]|uniref:Polyprotein n=1 Tax=Gossypium australe TaxID=47621 RepID=A0A5B6WH75_9ROSI|nr:polyprotein [Gossypium australe]
MSNNGSLLAELVVKLTFLSQILDEQMKDVPCEVFKQRMISGKTTNFSLGNDVELRFMNRMFVPVGHGLRKDLLRETHQEPFSFHLRSIKIKSKLNNRYSKSGNVIELLWILYQVCLSALLKRILSG